MTLVLIIGLLMTVVALTLAARRAFFLFRAISHGQPAPDRIQGAVGRLGNTLKRQGVEVLGQKKLLKWSIPGAAHFFVFWAFLILGTVYLEAYAVLLSRDPEWSWFVFGNWAVLGFLQDFIAVMCLLGIGTFWWIRIVNNPKNQGRKSRFFGSHLGPAYLTLFMIFNVIWTLFLFRGAVQARDMGTDDGYGKAAFVSYGLGKVLPDSTALIGIGLLLHIGVMLVFLIFVLNSKHLHIFVAPLNVMFGREPVALGAAKPMMSGGKALTLDDLEDLDEDAKLGVGAAEDFSWKGVLDMASCTECGRCQDQCPAWNTEKPLSPKLMMMALRDHTLSKTPYLLADEDKREALLEGNEALAREVERPLVGDTGDDWFYMPDSGAAVIDPDVLWSCVTCGACVNQCPVDIEHVDHIVDMRRYQVLVESNFPSELNGLFKGMENKGNPWNMSPTARLDWAKDLPFEVKVLGEDVADMDDVDWLFWVGCAGAYEDRAKKTTRAVAELLDMAGVSFAVLGNGETCTGDSARRAGNEFVFQGLAAQNIETFKEHKVKKVVSTCAHCFNTLKNEYSQLGIELEVVHHTQLLNRLVREKKLVPVASNGGGDKRSVTYHDPCYIGRHNGVYSPPRELLNVIPDAELKEMPRNSERSFCCGAGGARMWMEETIGTRINETRTMEAVETGADQIAVGCPFCRVMLSDGLTAAQSKGDAREEVEVLDVAQMLLASVKGESRPAAKKATAASSSGSSEGSGGGTATATIEREDSSTDEATKAEPDADDVTQTEDTVTDTEDVGAAAKASGGGSLFDLGDDSAEEPESKDETEDQPEAKTEEKSGGSLFDLGDDESSDDAEPEAKTEEKPKAADEGFSGGSLFDVGGDEDSAEPEPEPEPEDKAEEKAEPEPEAKQEAPASSGAASTPGTEIPEGGSLFDIEAPAEEEVATPAPAEPSTEDTGDVDRTQDDADTDVEPEDDQEETAPEPEAKQEAPASSGAASTPGTEIPEGGSLFDIEAPAEEEVATPAPAEPSTEDTGDVDRTQDDADTDVEPEDDQEETAPEPEAKQEAPASSGAASTPGTEIPEGGSLFDIEAPAEEEVATAAPAEPSTEDTGEDIDRSQDDADTDVEPETEPETEDEPQAESDDDAGITSLRDIKAKYSGEAEESTDEPEPEPESADDSDEAEDEPQDDEDEDEAEEKPKPTSSGESHQPRTDAEIGEGGSLFDL